jgi:hypothetical protein
MICTIFMQADTNDLHDIHADSYEEFCMILFIQLRTFHTIFKTVTNDLHDIHVDNFV